ncbi:WD40 repeat-like protein [Rhizopogon vinicolor AM-OR11-026]|uniref:WD40 repeat-like protein n=1 Tax=Rhizopogon vinicolor AM-OR11-026 TaxID=1314800 RepID=A0A1B7N3P0_9AGAM|nr:WD40 repeat-like protein [Rhizopogon vinicolor AM-OR11-026]
MKKEGELLIVRSSAPARKFDNLGEVASIRVFLDGRRMATTSSDGTLRVWDLKNRIMLKEMDERGEGMRDMALSRDGKLIASSDYGGYVNAWRGDTGRPLTQAFDSGANSLDLSPDGATLATGSQRDQRIKLWSTDTWKLLQGEMNCSRQIHCVRYSPSGKLLAVATDHDIQIWNPATSQRIKSLGQHYRTHSLVWTPDGTRLLSAGNPIIREWDSSTWLQVGDIWTGETDSFCQCIAVNSNGTLIAYTTIANHVRLWRISDRRTIAIFQHSDTPCCVTFSIDGKHILAGGKDKKISEWTVPEHAWPENALKDKATHQTQDYDTEAQDCDTEARDTDAEAQGSETKILTMDTKARSACISGDLPTAEELLTQEIDTNGNNYCAYANRSVVLSRKVDWDHALEDATMSISIRPSLMGYISFGIALCGKNKVRDAKRAFDLAFTFADGDSKTIHFLFMIKAIALFNASQRAEAMHRIRELGAACPDASITLACRTIEVYLHVQLGNNALDRACPIEAADHFTAAVNTGTFLSKSAVHSKYEEFVVLFGCDFASLWQTANQKRCHALLRAGKLAEVFEACQFMADMSDETTRADSLNWSIGFMKELSTFQDHVPKLESTPDMCKYDDGNDSISDIDSDIEHVDNVVS